MTYRLDDESAFDARLVDAGNEAVGACDRAGRWCAHKLTDGVFPRSIALAIAQQRVWDKAVKAQLLEALEDGSYRLVDFFPWNETAEQAKLKREKARERMTAKRSRSVRANISETSPEHSPKFTPPQEGEWEKGLGSDPEGSAEGNPRPETPFDLARRVWADEWQRLKRSSYTFSPIIGAKGEDGVIRAIGQWAAEHGGEDAERFARHLVSMYLRDKDPYVSNPNHPIKLLGARLNQYGEPPRKRPPESVTRVKVDEPAEVPLSAKELAERAAAFAKKGAA